MQEAAASAPGPGLDVGLGYATRTGRWVVAATVLGSGMASLDATVVGVALPTIGRQFGTGLADLQWVVTAYALTLAGLLLVGGGLGDRYGRRSVFVLGAVWFALASLACGLAPSAAVLILARAFQGAGAALLTPGSLAILQATFAPEDRSKAIGAWSGFGGVATAVGPFLGGWLISAVSWRLIFFINLPVAAAVVAISARHVPESRDPTAAGRPDGAGAALVTCGLVGVVFGLIEGPGWGWGAPLTVVSVLGGAVLLAAFFVVETRQKHPMLPLTLFRARQFSAANAVTFGVYAALGGALFLLPIQLQQVSRYSPLEAGSALLPITALMLALSARSGALAARIGPRLQMTAGPLVAAAGLALLSRLDASGGYLGQVLPAVAVFGLGLAITVAPLTAAVLAAAPAQHSGIASAVNNGVARLAGLIAVAVLPALVGITGSSYRYPDAFAAGFHLAAWITAAACAAGGVLAFLTVRNPAPPPPAGQELHCALDAPPLRSAPSSRVANPARPDLGRTARPRPSLPDPPPGT